MKRVILPLVVGLAFGIALTLTYMGMRGGWYSYEMLPIGLCADFKRGLYDPSPGRIAPNQPNECYIQTPRFHLP
jgi:hypothetical protein